MKLFNVFANAVVLSNLCAQNCNTPTSSTRQCCRNDVDTRLLSEDVLQKRTAICFPLLCPKTTLCVDEVFVMCLPVLQYRTMLEHIRFQHANFTRVATVSWSEELFETSRCVGEIFTCVCFNCGAKQYLRLFLWCRRETHDSVVEAMLGHVLWSIDLH